MYKSESNMKHPKYRGDTGYVLNLGKVRLYLAGSNGVSPELKRLKNIHIACMNMQGTMQLDADEPEKAGAAGDLAYSLNGREAVEVMKLLKPAVFFPNYWLPVQRADIEYAAAHAPKGVRFIIDPPWER
jgi:L-ascorbate metabolism protein UlaG (beta-lactamase superfamily)